MRGGESSCICLFLTFQCVIGVNSSRHGKESVLYCRTFFSLITGYIFSDQNAGNSCMSNNSNSLLVLVALIEVLCVVFVILGVRVIGMINSCNDSIISSDNSVNILVMRVPVVMLYCLLG